MDDAMKNFLSFAGAIYKNVLDAYNQKPWAGDKKPLTEEQCKELMEEGMKMAERMWDSGIIFDSTSKSNQTPAKVATTTTKESTKSGGLEDVAGMNELKKIVRQNFINPVKYPKSAKVFGIVPPCMLLYGPPGCGKSYLAEAIAKECGLKYKLIVPDDLASIYLHGSQQKIGNMFDEIEKDAPAILIIDEVDSLIPKRGSDSEDKYLNGETNEFLSRLNKISEKGVYVIATTNHPELIDGAALRTGRFDERIYVGMPDKAARKALFKYYLDKRPVAADIDYDELASKTAAYNCSDIEYIVKKAAAEMFNTYISKGKMLNDCVISQSVLETVIASTPPSVNKEDLKAFENVSQRYSAVPSHSKKTTPFEYNFPVVHSKYNS